MKPPSMADEAAFIFRGIFSLQKTKGRKTLTVTLCPLEIFCRLTMNLCHHRLRLGWVGSALCDLTCQDSRRHACTFGGSSGRICGYQIFLTPLAELVKAVGRDGWVGDVFHRYYPEARLHDKKSFFLKLAA